MSKNPFLKADQFCMFPPTKTIFAIHPILFVENYTF